MTIPSLIGNFYSKFLYCPCLIETPSLLPFDMFLGLVGFFFKCYWPYQVGLHKNFFFSFFPFLFFSFFLLFFFFNKKVLAVSFCGLPWRAAHVIDKWETLSQQSTIQSNSSTFFFLKKFLSSFDNEICSYKGDVKNFNSLCWF